MRRALSMLLTMLVLQAPAHAQVEVGYVTDNLRVGLHQSSDTSDRPSSHSKAASRWKSLSDG